VSAFPAILSLAMLEMLIGASGAMPPCTYSVPSSISIPVMLVGIAIAGMCARDTAKGNPIR